MTKALLLAPPAKGDIEADGAKIRETILQRIWDGESLRSICSDKAMPARSTVHLWLANIEGFSDQYARACEIRADVYADQIWKLPTMPLGIGSRRKTRTARPLRFLTGRMCSGLGCGLIPGNGSCRKWRRKSMATALRWAAIQMRLSDIAFRFSL